MNGEHNTPVGTPVVIAPGKIPLVGEYTVLEDGSAVLAAITRYAKAQFISRMDAMSPMVSDIVKRAKTDLGDVAAAMPPGSVLVNTDEFHQGSERSGFGTSAAIAVASVGAVFESLGLSIRDRKSRIFDIADGARRASQGNVGSGADLAAAAHGGFIRVVRHKDASTVVEPMAALAGLHLVLFSADHAVTTQQVREGVQQYAKRDTTGFGRAMEDLRDIAQRFAEELAAGSATGALVAAGRYGDRLAKLAADASVPIVTDAFRLASELAQALGGIAKPTGAGGGAVGVAMFATPEAARLFRRACPESLTCLDGDLDRLGVRCQADGESEEDADEESGETKAIAASEAAPPQPARDVVVIGARAEEAVTVRGPVARDSEQEPVPDVVPLDLRDRRGLRRRVLRGAAIGGAIALVLVAWIAVPKPIRARVRGASADPSLPAETGLVKAPSLPARGGSATPAADPPSPENIDLPANTGPRPAPAAPTDNPMPAHVAKQARKVASTKPARIDGSNSQKHLSTTRLPAGAAKPFVPRAGTLTPDDF